MMDVVAKRGICAITKRDRVEAVLMSIEEYEALMARVPDPVAKLTSEFDELLAEMQSPRAKKAARSLFEAAPAKLGRAAVKAARRG
jgi:PHD/YefM family antitoxin component YafN of YafNO toxin-antitoxin module